MSWTAVVPIKQGAARKSRLAGELSIEERGWLSDHLVAHVLAALAAAPSVSRVVALSSTRFVDPSSRRKPGSMVTGANDLGRPFGQEPPAAISMDPGFRRDDGKEDIAWHIDEGRGLNPELTAFRATLPAGRLLVIHGDLPLVGPDDIEALIAAAEQAGIAIAPDRHGSGTNALAIRDAGPFSFAFGEDSCAVHRAAGGALVARPGLSHDIDTPDDLAAARAAGFAWPR